MRRRGRCRSVVSARGQAPCVSVGRAASARAAARGRAHDRRARADELRRVAARRWSAVRCLVATTGLDARPRRLVHDRIATDAPLDSAALRRLATRAFAGMARTGASFSHGSGDYAIAFSTTGRGERSLHGDTLSQCFVAVADATEQAILDSLCAAETTTGMGAPCGHCRSTGCGRRRRSDLRSSERNAQAPWTAACAAPLGGIVIDGSNVIASGSGRATMRLDLAEQWFRAWRPDLPIQVFIDSTTRAVAGPRSRTNCARVHRRDAGPRALRRGPRGEPADPYVLQRARSPGPRRVERPLLRLRGSARQLGVTVQFTLAGTEFTVFEEATWFRKPGSALRVLMARTRRPALRRGRWPAR